jgi:hypothetical protein
MKRSYNTEDNEPESKKFDRPSEKEHLLQVIDIFDYTSEMGQKLNLDENTVSVKLEVVGGDEAGRTMLCRLSLSDQDKGFFFTRMFLKATGQDYKGTITIDTDLWCGLQCYATIKHNGDYANIKEYNFEKKIEQVFQVKNPGGVKSPEEILWDDAK